MGRAESDLGKSLAVGAGVAGVAVVAVVAAPLVLTAVGFTSAGVVAGSAAAGIQSLVYGGATCGLFSVAQSIGAAGIGLAAKGALVATAGAAGAAGHHLKNK
eukprot:Phypoly_transcript_25384.p1 GENE.Phypoly_transcript_25384~~Phypoly_transcript_25384.p1  ORF type:complete len:102 (+),score=15.04 Phypoly_transcript_25384:155-460(+)